MVDFLTDLFAFVLLGLYFPFAFGWWGFVFPVSFVNEKYDGYHAWSAIFSQIVMNSAFFCFWFC